MPLFKRLGISVIALWLVEQCHSFLGKIFEKTILLPGYILLIVYNEHINWKNKETVDIQPISFPPQRQITAFGSPKQLIILWTTGTIDDHRILGFPTHITFNPYLFNPIFPTVGLFLVCSSAWLIFNPYIWRA